MTEQFNRIVLAVGTLLFATSLCWAQTEGAVDSPVPACNALAGTDFSEIQDAPTQIVAASVIEAKDGQPPFCQVQGYAWPQVGFELRLPLTNWNGKFFEVGCGGACGSTGWVFWCPLDRGYACIASDMGHKGKDQDMLWSYNNWQAQIDFDTRGAHVAALAGKAITERYYQKAPGKAYFMGCSNGGIQALAEAQRFPWDFDGIISVSGAPSFSNINMEILWGARALRGEDGRPILSQQDERLVHNAAVARCDMDDGVKDGVISDPYHCNFDPAEQLCKGGKETDCLTEAQVEAVKKVYAGPMTSTGEKKSYMRGAAPGSELGWIGDVGGNSGYILSGTQIGGGEEWALEAFRYMGFVPAPGRRWTLTDFDFDRDYKRLGTSEMLWGTSNPDLRPFKEAGGKLIVAQGWNDSSAVPSGPIDYYETTERTMGGRAATQSFFRLFVVPGMGHCTGGDGAFAIDYVTSIEDWAEHGRAPDKLIGAHVPGEDWSQDMTLKFPLNSSTPVSFTRPVYPYPLRAKYKGSGDPNKAQNFEAVGP